MKRLNVSALIICLLAFGWTACNEQHAPALQRAERSARSATEEAAPAPPPPPAGALAKAKNDEAPADAFVTSVATVGKFDTLKKFIRTAELRFRVTNAIQSTLAVESIAVRNGGFVVENDLETEIENRTLTPVSADSSLETTRFSRHNQVTIRVPYTMLDTTLRAIGHLAEFLDYRRVKARDVGFDMLEQELTRARQQLYEAQVGGANSGKTRDITLAADKLLESRTTSDEAKLNALKIEDQIKYSTVQLDIYQDAKTQYRLVARERPVAAFQPGFGSRIMEALSMGWAMIQFILLGIIQLWGVFLFVGLGWMGYRYFRKK
jgi:hypothetical protein